MPYSEAVRDLYQQFQDFVQQKTDPQVAIEVLNALFEDATPSLSSLLNEYYKDAVVFTPLFCTNDPGYFAELFIFLIQKNDRVLNIPIKKDGPPIDTVFNYFFNEENTAQQNTLLKWLDINKPQYMEEAKAQKKKVHGIMNSALGELQNKSSEKAIALLTNRPIELIHEVLTADNAKLLDAIFTYSYNYDSDLLNFLIKLDISIIRIEYLYGGKLLSSLCNDRLIYAEPIKLIKEIYGEELFGDEEVEIEEALNFHDEEDEKEEDLASQGQAATTLDLGLKAPKTPLISIAALNALSLTDSPIQSSNLALFSRINTSRTIENTVLDITIQKLFVKQLMSQGVVVLPTIRRDEPISREVIARIQNREPILYPSEMIIDKEGVSVSNFIEITPNTPVRYLVWPVNDSHRVHYGLFMLDLGRNPSESPRGYYFEPIQNIITIDMFQKAAAPALQQIIVRDTIRLQNDTTYQKQILQQLSPCLHAYYLKELIKGLDIPWDAISFVCLGQTPLVNYCSDYLVAILSKLHLGEIDLSQNAEGLLALEGCYLDEQAVQHIRLLTIQACNNMDYFDFQLDQAEQTRSTAPVNASPISTIGAIPISDAYIKSREEEPLNLKHSIPPEKRKRDDEASLYKVVDFLDIVKQIDMAMNEPKKPSEIILTDKANKKAVSPLNPFRLYGGIFSEVPSQNSENQAPAKRNKSDATTKSVSEEKESFPSTRL